MPRPLSLFPRFRNFSLSVFLMALCLATALFFALPPALAVPLTVQGGDGDGGTNSAVGNDGTDDISTESGTSYDYITVTGGNGGNGDFGSGNRGGKGGDAGITLDATTVSTGFITIQGGQAGDTGAAGGSAGDEGGNARLTVDVGTTLTSTGPVSVYGGTDGSSGSWGGVTTLNVQGALIAPSVRVEKADADVSVYIATLDVSSLDTTLTSIGLTSATNFSITNADLSGGHLLAIDNSVGEMEVTNLNVNGPGRLYVADGTKLSIDTLTANNQTLTFLLPASLRANDTVVKTRTANLWGTTIGLDYWSARPSLNVGDQFVLLEAPTSMPVNLTSLTVVTPNGDIYTLSVNGNEIVALLDFLSLDTPAYERLKAYAESRAVSLAFVNQGADLILNQGMGSALATTSGPGFKIASFAAGAGGWSRYNTGSHVDVSGFSMLAGVALGNDAGPGRITLGAFFEGGWGSYDSYNSFSNYASVDGDGNTSYYGGGILGRYDLTSGAAAGLYFDASARMGRADTDFNTSDIRYFGNDADFDSDSMYWGAHAGLGYQWSLTEKAMLDLSGKFIWTRQDSDSVNVHGDKVRFDSADSLRTRLGGRFNYAVCEYVTPYAGAYWEHEFDGEQNSSVNSVGMDSPDLKGDTGVGELGLTFRPVKDSGFSFDLGVQGYTGVREGVTGSLQLKYEF